MNKGSSQILRDISPNNNTTNLSNELYKSKTKMNSAVNRKGH